MLTKPDDSILTEYLMLENRHAKLVLEGKEIQKEHDEDVKYYIENHISNIEWKNNLERTASNLGSASVKIRIGRGTLDRIRCESLFGLR